MQRAALHMCEQHGQKLSLLLRSTSSLTKFSAKFQPIPESDNTEPMFTVTVKNGFLPRKHPLVELPHQYHELESLLQRMPIRMKNGQPGLLANGSFGTVVENELPMYNVSKETDVQVLSALFRDYTIVLSAYLLEPCDVSYRKEKIYGRGREKVPRNLAVPLTKLAQTLCMRPFMEYASSYILNNYKVKNLKEPLMRENMEVVRTFSEMPSEIGFIITHLAMVRYSPSLVKHTLEVLDACNDKDREAFNLGLRSFISTFKGINSEMKIMWQASRSSDYAQFRTFMMGTKDQNAMFPDGIIYEGVSTEPQHFHKATGANDNIIPTADYLLELTSDLPVKALTEIVEDFREYRPPKHNEWLVFVESKAKQLGVRKFALEDPVSTMLYLQALDQNRDFRHRHWNLTKEYVIKMTKQPRTTYDSLIFLWLPHQLDIVLKTLIEVGHHAQKIVSHQDPQTRSIVTEFTHRAKEQARMLERDMVTLNIRQLMS